MELVKKLLICALTSAEVDFRLAIVEAYNNKKEEPKMIYIFGYGYEKQQPKPVKLYKWTGWSIKTSLFHLQYSES